MLDVAGIAEQGYGVYEEILRLQGLEGGFEFNNCAVLAREWKDLDQLRSIFEAKNIPVNLH